MMKPIQDLPEGVSGIVAQGTVTKHDYRAVLRPMLETAASAGEPIRLLYVFGDEFEGFTPGAAWEDVNLAFDHLRDVERCAVVSDGAWVKAASQLMGALMPTKVRKFEPGHWDEAVDWLGSRESASQAP